MQLEEILTPQRCYCRMDWSSKKRILTKISDLLAGQNLAIEPEEIYTALMAREQLGSTGLGNGIAIPHCRVANCQEIIGSLITLEQAVDYDSIDGKPVDLLFVLIVPQERSDDHVKTLAGLAEMLSDEDFCFTLRTTNDSEDLYNIAITY
ncbi:MAG: PTS IIA-like nitrogen regulatory protein PtsN [Pseudomonadales bacterium]|nr:PTS IIA-like nitrogen regulatory protein PtsN [Pseudomonadales bacterium]